MLSIAPGTVLAQAETFPDGPLTLIVPFPAGGGVDVVGRILAKSLSVELKQSVVVENKPGASGMIGAGYAATAKPNGLTMLLASSGETALKDRKSVVSGKSVYVRVVHGGRGTITKKTTKYNTN